MKYSNILKIVDIQSTEFAPEFIEWLKAEISPEYTDTDETFNEHIWSLNDIHEQMCDTTLLVDSHLEQLDILLKRCDSGYFRIVD